MFTVIVFFITFNSNKQFIFFEKRCPELHRRKEQLILQPVLEAIDAVLSIGEAVINIFSNTFPPSTLNNVKLKWRKTGGRAGGSLFFSHFTKYYCLQSLKLRLCSTYNSSVAVDLFLENIKSIERLLLRILLFLGEELKRHILDVHFEWSGKMFQLWNIILLLSS